MSEMNSPMTQEEQVYLLWDKEEIKNTINRFAYYTANDDRRRAISELWVSEPEHCKTASLGYNNGYYTGMEHIIQHYVVDSQNDRYARLSNYHSASGVELSERNLGYGCSFLHTMNTPLIEVAGDGKTAKLLAYDCGLTCIGSPDGDSDSNFTFAKVYVDFAKEADTFKIWHLLVAYDHIIPAGHSYGELNPEAPWGADVVERACGDPTVRDVAYDALYGWTDVWERLPRPYYSFDPSKAYTAEGKPACYKIGLYK